MAIDYDSLVDRPRINGHVLTGDQSNEDLNIASTLDELHNTNITNPSNGQVLKYNGTRSKWENANESGGSTERVTKLAYGAEPDLDVTGAAELVVTEYGDYSSYLSYNSSTHKFTVLQDFYANIVAWVEIYQQSSGSGNGQLMVNNDVIASYNTGGTSIGSVGGTQQNLSLHTGDLVWVNTPNSNGWRRQRIKIYTVSEEMYEFLRHGEYNNAC